MSRKWQLQWSIFLEAIAGIQYNLNMNVDWVILSYAGCSFACDILSQNHLKSFPEHRALFS